MNRTEAFALVTEYTRNPSLVKHMLAVEAAMRAYARKLGEDEEKWGIVGLLHDFDYERWPDPPNHPLKGSEILRERGYPDDVIYKTIVLELLQERPQMHEELRQKRQLLATLNQLAGQLRNRHHAWMEELTPVNPGGSPTQIASRALEIAVKELTGPDKTYG